MAAAASTTRPSDDSRSAALDFGTAFGPVAHHFYPDGCPTTAATATATANLESVWPVRQDRTTIPPPQALQSVQDTVAYSHRHGLTAPQMDAVSLIAVATLGSTGGGGGIYSSSSSVGAGSPLVDGSCRHFCSLVRSLLPATTAAEPEPDTANNSNNDASLSASTVCRLLSAVGTLGDSVATTASALSTVLRFLTLAVRHGALAPLALQHLQGPLYPTLFHHCLPSTSTKVITTSSSTTAATSIPKETVTRIVDAARLLLAVTLKRHVRADRVRTLAAAVTVRRAPFHSKSTSQRPVVAWWAVSDLFLRYNPAVGTAWLPTSPGFFSSSSSNNNNNNTTDSSSSSMQWYVFPDAEWERAFSGDRGTPRQNHRHEHQPPSKRPRWSSSPGVTHAMPSWNGPWTSATAVLQSSDMRHALLLSNVNNDSVTRLQTCLPYMLHQEWYNATSSGKKSGNGKRDEMELDRDDPLQQGEPTAVKKAKDTRWSLLQALADFVTHTDALPLAAERFVLADILPLWDGTDEWSQLLCHAILPALRPCGWADLQSGLLCHLERFFHYGSPRMQYAIVSGALASLVNRWGRLDWSTVVIAVSDTAGIASTRAGSRGNALKIQTLRELIEWTDNLLLEGFLVDGHGHELLRTATVDFFAGVCDLTDHCSFLAAPSPSLVYRLLLSKSALHVDRVCLLLVKYRTTFQKLKQRQQEEDHDVMDDVASGLDRVKVFNCFVWDFCCVLWRCSPPPDLRAEESSTANRSILYTAVRPETQSQLYAAASKVAFSLSITHGAVFAGYAADFASKSIATACPSPDQIRGKLKAKYLDYLKEDHGMQGIHAFLSSFVASLANRSASSRRQPESKQQQF